VRLFGRAPAHVEKRFERGAFFLRQIRGRGADHARALVGRNCVDHTRHRLGDRPAGRTLETLDQIRIGIVERRTNAGQGVEPRTVPFR
jgi:hypothetical protein